LPAFFHFCKSFSQRNLKTFNSQRNFGTFGILLALEAMKMETNITAPSAGKIAAIRVNQGDPVQAGAVVEFE
jgi:pyruvate carboxylase